MGILSRQNNLVEHGVGKLDAGFYSKLSWENMEFKQGNRGRKGRDRTEMISDLEIVIEDSTKPIAWWNPKVMGVGLSSSAQSKICEKILGLSIFQTNKTPLVTGFKGRKGIVCSSGGGVVGNRYMKCMKDTSCCA